LRAVLPTIATTWRTTPTIILLWLFLHICRATCFVINIFPIIHLIHSAGVLTVMETSRRVLICIYPHLHCPTGPPQLKLAPKGRVLEIFRSNTGPHSGNSGQKKVHTRAPVLEFFLLGIMFLGAAFWKFTRLERVYRRPSRRSHYIWYSCSSRQACATYAAFHTQG